MIGSRETKLWLSVAKNLCVAVITFAIGIAANLAWTNIRTSPQPQQPSFDYAEFGTLRRTILDAKARGDKTVELSVMACGWEIGSLKAALSRDTVILADLVGKKTYEGSFGLHTWYRFKIRETLVEHRTRHAWLFKDAPSDMLPIAEDEFLIMEVNGQLEIDGVTVTQRSNGAKYLEGQTYLLFLWLDPSKRTAIRSGTDPLGVFLVDSNGNLSSYRNDSYPLKTALAKRFNSSLKDFRRALKK